MWLISCSDRGRRARAPLRWRWRLGGLGLALVGAVQASQPTPPVSIEVGSEGAERDRIVLVVQVRANVEVEGANLVFEGLPRELQVERARSELRLRAGDVQTVQVPVTVRAAGVHRFDLRVRARARDFEEAGSVERRYLVWDGSAPPRLLTGRQVRREEREAVERKVRESQRGDPAAALGIDELLRRPLQPLRQAPGEQRAVPQALVPPAAGIEPYEAQLVVDRTADVIRDLDPVTVTGRLFYTDRGGVARPLVNATVDVRDSDTGPDEQLISVLTGWDGRFSAVVNNDDGWFQNGRDIYIRVRTTNGRFRVQDCAAWPDWTYAWVSDVRSDLSDGTVVDFGNLATNADNEAALLFQDLNQGWNFLTTEGAQDPGFVDLCWPEDASVYSRFWEEIDIEDGDEVARDIVLHEYGHATMHNAYDGDWPSDTGGPHGFDDLLHPNMAFTEGWGTFIALAVNDDGIYHSNGWSRRIEAFNHSSGHSAGDGLDNEGHVAAGMNDVRDASTDGSCSGGADCDASGAQRARMSQIWRDSFWRSKADDLAEYWPRLCAELDPGQGDVAATALRFNATGLAPCKCTVRLVLASHREAEREVSELRTLRDRGLRSHPLGQRAIELYYRHTDEVGTLLGRDPELQARAADLFLRAAEHSRMLLAGRGGAAVPLDAEHARLAREVIAELQKRGSPALQREFEEVRRMIDTFEGRSLAEIERKFAAPRKAR